MKITNGPVDYTKPGFYWDGASAHFVTAEGVGYMLGGQRYAIEFVEREEAPEPAKADPDKVLTVADAVSLINAARK